MIFIINGLELPSYRGDIINDITFDEKLRQPDSNRMLKAYSQSASTIALLKSFSDRGYADLKHLQSWNMEFVKNHKQEERYHHLTNKIKDSLKFMETTALTRNDMEGSGQELEKNSRFYRSPELDNYPTVTF